jgi:hypothetical protein
MTLCYFINKEILDLFTIANAISSVLLTIATFYYVRLTWRLANESKAQREALTEPKIHIGLESNTRAKNLIELYVENIGHGIAYNVRFNFTKDFILDHNKKLSEIGIFKSGIKAFGPNKNYRTYITSLIEDTENKQNNPIEVEVIYDTIGKKDIKEIFHLDFSELIGLLYLGNKDPMDLLIKSIDNLTNEIKNK